MTNTILCINGSDSIGHSGIQADIRTIRDLGGYGVTVVTSVTVQNSSGITDIYELPSELVVGQVKAVYEETHPDVVKVGMINNPDTIRDVRNEILGCRQIVCSPVILSSFGGLLMSNDSIRSYCRNLLPICSVLIIKCTDAEIILGHRICTDDDMLTAAAQLHQMGAAHVLLRGGTYSQGRINALFSSSGNADHEPFTSFFSSVNIEGWQKHGVGGTLSTAIAVRLSNGDEPLQAINSAHNYLHTQVVYSSSPARTGKSGVALYNRFMSLLADNYTQRHDVAFYADALAISMRYLSQITGSVCGRTPKQIIDDFLLKQSEQQLHTTTLTIQEVSNSLGFSSQMAFAKFFKAKKGISPSLFRQGG